MPYCMENAGFFFLQHYRFVITVKKSLNSILLWMESLVSCVDVKIRLEI